MYEKALDPITGYMSRDEVRALENLPPESTREVTPEQIIAQAERPAPAVVNGNGNGAS